MNSQDAIDALLTAIRHDMGDKLVFGEPTPMTRDRSGQKVLTAKARDSISSVVSALANHPGGGVLALGVRSEPNPEIVGVGDPEVIGDAVDALFDGMVPRLQPECRVYRDGHRVVYAVRVPYLAVRDGCYDRRRGLSSGRFRIRGQQVVPWPEGRRPSNTRRHHFGRGRRRRGGAPRRAELELVERARIETLDGPWLRRVLATANVTLDEDRWQFDPRGARLAALGVVGGESFSRKPTIAGVLAFASRPERFVAGAQVVVVDDRGMMRNKVVGDVVRLARAVASTASSRAEVPTEVVEELVRNAWVHRDWGGAAGRVPIQLVLRRDGFSLVSPGVLLRTDDLRNPTLQDLLRRRGVVEARGGGLERVRSMIDRKATLDVYEAGQETCASLRLCRAPGLGPPRPTRSGAGRPSERGARSGSAEQAKPERPSGPSSRSGGRRAPDRTLDLLRLLEDGGERTRREIESALGWSRSKTRDVLARLVAEGRIQQSASDPRSPRQSYRLA